MQNIKMSAQFGPYILLKQLGVGGMAETWLAVRQIAPGVRKLLVLKCILPSYNDNPDYVRLFYHEAGIGLRLQHPCLISTWDCCPIEGRHAMVMEYLCGTTLHELMERLKQLGVGFKLETAAWICAQILDGLDYLYNYRDESGQELRIIHRDVSPQNIFICYDGQCRLFDFGVAQTIYGSPDVQSGMIVGKTAYMSPEQCECANLDGRSDMFSLACVLYEMATGISPFERGDDIQTINAVMSHSVQAPSNVIRDFPAFLSRIIMHGLEHQRERRYESAAEFSADLRNYLKVIGKSNGQSTVSALMNDVFRNEIEQNRSFLSQVLRQVESSGATMNDLVSSSRPVNDIPTGRVVESITISKISLSQAQQGEASRALPPVPGGAVRHQN